MPIPEDNEARCRREQFFLRSGFYLTGIDIEQGGSVMELLSTFPELCYEECERVYHSLYGANYRDIVKRVIV